MLIINSKSIKNYFLIPILELPFYLYQALSFHSLSFIFLISFPKELILSPFYYFLPTNFLNILFTNYSHKSLQSFEEYYKIMIATQTCFKLLQINIQILQMNSLTKNKDFLMENYGGRILVMQEKASHQKNLSSIYSKKLNHYYSQPSLNKIKINKKQEHLDREHLKNIKHLYQFISRKKSMQDRNKDPHDFFAYPVYFFRQAEKNKKPDLKKKRKVTKSKRNSQSQQSQYTRLYGIDIPTVKNYLPDLEEFNERQLEQFASAITKLIVTFQLNSMERIQFLKKCVLKTAKPHYPDLFSDIVQEIFEEVLQSLNFHFH